MGASRRSEKCHYCAVRLLNDPTGPLGYTRDHIVPKFLGGVNASWNIVMACRACNEAKASAWPTCRCKRCARSKRKHREQGRLPKHYKWITPDDIDRPKAA